jgi:hypothetical protein
MELEKTRAAGPEVSHMPLTYCLLPLKSALKSMKGQANLRVEMEVLLSEADRLGKDRKEKTKSGERSRLCEEVQLVLKELQRFNRKSVGKLKKQNVQR